MEPKTFTGSQASCKVFMSDIEATAEAQIRTFLDCPAFTGCQIRVMPDVHAGAGAVIGFTSTLGPGVCPNVIGVDIGCGVLALKLRAREVDFAAFDGPGPRLMQRNRLHTRTPFPRFSSSASRTHAEQLPAAAHVQTSPTSRLTSSNGNTQRIGLGRSRFSSSCWR